MDLPPDVDSVRARLPLETDDTTRRWNWRCKWKRRWRRGREEFRRCNSPDDFHPIEFLSPFRSCTRTVFVARSSNARTRTAGHTRPNQPHGNDKARRKVSQSQNISVPDEHGTPFFRRATTQRGKSTRCRQTKRRSPPPATPREARRDILVIFWKISRK